VLLGVGQDALPQDGARHVAVRSVLVSTGDKDAVAIGVHHVAVINHADQARLETRSAQRCLGVSRTSEGGNLGFGLHRIESGVRVIRRYLGGDYVCCWSCAVM